LQKVRDLHHCRIFGTTNADRTTRLVQLHTPQFVAQTGRCIAMICCDDPPDLTDTSAFVAAFRVMIDIRVAWGEVDALGHANNAVSFHYLASSRIAFIRSLALDDVRKCLREGKSPLSLLKPA
jgi:hypothetical protein